MVNTPANRREESRLAADEQRARALANRMHPQVVDVRQAPDQVEPYTLEIGIPAYNEAAGVVPTLESIWAGLRGLAKGDAAIILSDSCTAPSLSSVEAATRWARQAGARLIVDHVDRRRSLKEALNAIFERSDSDLLVLVNADVLVPPASLAALLGALLEEPRPEVVVGAIRPDPNFSSLRRRAGLWQMRAVWRASVLMDRSIHPGSFRSEGAFWGTWRTFYANYRFPVGSGSIADDTELTRALVRMRARATNAAEAFVYKVPPGSFSDLCIATVRFRVAAAHHVRRRLEYVAALHEGVGDPIGALLYAVARMWCVARYRRARRGASELWMPVATTKRIPPGS